MNINQHTTPGKLERYSFLWSEARLVIAAAALFLGGYPPVLYLNRAVPDLYALTSPLLELAWIISGVASAYLLFRWVKNGQMLFGGKNTLDMVLFLVSVVSGINLGLAGLLNQNFGMSIAKGSQTLFVITGVIYLFAAYHLHRRWKARGEKLF